MRRVSRVGRIAAVAAVVVAVVVVGVILFRSAGGGYTVTASFTTASQLVKGNLVQIDGTKAGTVGKLEITDNGRAQIELKIDDTYAPLRRGTKAVIRQSSQSGIANRYVDLILPATESESAPDNEVARNERNTGVTSDPQQLKKLPPIDDGGRIEVDDTTTTVDLDQLFNTFDPETRKALQGFFKGSARQFAGKGVQANAGFLYLNPALSTSRRLFGELNRDTPVLERFLVDSSKLVGALAERRDDLAALIGNLNETTGALGNQKAALAETIERLPPFMRRSNTTFVNLRAALNDVDPLVDASKPVARQLGPVLAEARGLAADGRPTVKNLSRIVRRKGKANDLTDLVKTSKPLAEAALDTKERSVSPGGRSVSLGRKRGAFPEAIDALEDSTPIIRFGRPYTPDLVGWFDDFSNRGAYDALGGVSRVQVYFNATTPQTGLPINLTDRPENFRQFAKIGQFRRCPGASEGPAPDGSNVLSAEEQQELDCLESDRATSAR